MRALNARQLTFPDQDDSIRILVRRDTLDKRSDRVTPVVRSQDSRMCTRMRPILPDRQL